MIESSVRKIPQDHPIRALFYTLTERGLEQQDLHDKDTVQYVSNLLTDFVDVEHMFRVRDESGHRLENTFDILREADGAFSREVRRDYYRHLGDITLFNLGLYPDSLTYGRHTVSPSFYAEQGRRSYKMVAAMDNSLTTEVFQRLSDHFERYVVGLHWVKLYINDPFYQYVFREFGVT